MKAIISLSGGMDSTTVLFEAIAQGRQVEAIGFNYGSKHNLFENTVARTMCKQHNIGFRLINIEQAMGNVQSNLLMDQGDIPEGHYEEESMSATVVPFRNTIMTSILCAIAQSHGHNEVWLGVHSGDHAIYPDCRPEYFDAFREVVKLSSEGKVDLKAPFLYGNKTSIIERGLQIGVPYHLTRTCYKQQDVACGKCGACQERLEAFAANRIDDPIEYESRNIL